MIPRVIHYCWFGGNPKPEIIRRCIESWRKFCPGWEIIEWNESNFDISQNEYMREAYEAKKWAFVSDVARLIIVEREGGIYMDTDVELLASIDNLLKYDAFYAFESAVNINSGLGFGAEASHCSVKCMLNYYDGRHFIVKGKPCMKPCPAGNTRSLMECYKSFERNGESQLLGKVKIFSYEEYSEFAKHHGAKTWVEGDVFEHQTYKDTKLKRFLRKPDRVNYIEEQFGERVFNIYVFLAYDLLENGVLYYVNRLIGKLKNNR